jgi:hypothetical protein
MEEGEQISTKPLQDKDHHGEILKIMRGAQGPTRMSRSGEQKDGEDKPYEQNQLGKRSFHRMV